jgi:hypothetical protein
MGSLLRNNWPLFTINQLTQLSTGNRIFPYLEKAILGRIPLATSPHYS